MYWSIEIEIYSVENCLVLFYNLIFDVESNTHNKEIDKEDFKKFKLRYIFHLRTYHTTQRNKKEGLFV